MLLTVHSEHTVIYSVPRLSSHDSKFVNGMGKKTDAYSVIYTSEVISIFLSVALNSCKYCFPGESSMVWCMRSAHHSVLLNDVIQSAAQHQCKRHEPALYQSLHSRYLIAPLPPLLL